MGGALSTRFWDKRVAVFAVRPSAVHGRRAISAPVVLGPRHQLDVLWIHASAISAQMVGHHVGRNGAALKNIRPPVGLPVLTVPELSVSLWIYSAHPLDASGHAVVPALLE